jgi:hypothetical protein
MVKYRYRFTIESNISINSKEKLIMEAYDNPNVWCLLESLGLVQLEPEEHSFLRDVIFDTEKLLETPEAIQKVRDQIPSVTEGFIKHVSWDLIY